MGDPVLETMIHVGNDTDWTVDMVRDGDRTLIVDSETNLVLGEILPDGTPVHFEVPKPYESEDI